MGCEEGEGAQRIDLGTWQAFRHEAQSLGGCWKAIQCAGREGEAERLERPGVAPDARAHRCPSPPCRWLTSQVGGGCQKEAQDAQQGDQQEADAGPHPPILAGVAAAGSFVFVFWGGGGRGGGEWAWAGGLAWVGGRGTRAWRGHQGSRADCSLPGLAAELSRRQPLPVSHRAHRKLSTSIPSICPGLLGSSTIQWLAVNSLIACGAAEARG